MKLIDMPEAVSELNRLAVKTPYIATTEIEKSAFYQAIQGKKELDISYSGLTPNAMELAGRIIANSETIKKVDMSYGLSATRGTNFAREYTEFDQPKRDYVKYNILHKMEAVADRLVPFLSRITVVGLPGFNEKCLKYNAALGLVIDEVKKNIGTYVSDEVVYSVIAGYVMIVEEESPVLERLVSGDSITD
jgi:hypothetical protein